MMTHGGQSNGVLIRALSIQGRYSPNDEIELKGTAAALRQVATVLALGSGSEKWALSHEPNAEPTPYEGWLSSVSIQRDEGMVRIALEGACLIIGGGSGALDLLARNVRALADSGTAGPLDVARHLHLEHHPGHLFLAADARPLVVTLMP